MKNFKLKLRKIYLPFALLFLGALAICSFLRWVYQPADDNLLTDEMVELYLPAVLSFVLCFIVMYPRLKILVNAKGKATTFVFYLVTAFVITIPNLVLQKYLGDSLGNLVSLSDIADIKKIPPARFYRLDRIVSDKRRASYHFEASASGRYNENLDFSIYEITPLGSLIKNVEDTSTLTDPVKLAYRDQFRFSRLLQADSVAWLGVKYTKSINNHLSNDEKVKKYNAFRAEMVDEFNRDDFQKTTYLTRLSNCAARNYFMTAIKQRYRCTGQGMPVLVQNFEPFSNRGSRALTAFFWATGIALLLWAVMIFFLKVDESITEGAEPSAALTSNDLLQSFKLLIPRPGYTVTPVLIDINVAVYVFMMCAGLGFISFSSKDLLAWGANYRPYAMQGEWWRLATSMFLHAGLMHIFSNMFCLLFIGLFLEPVLGTTLYLILYLVCGLAGSAASIYWHPATVSVGASGAIFGLYGAFLVLLLAKFFPPGLKKGMLASTSFFIIYNFAIGSVGGGIDNAAHLGGLMAGALGGLIMYPMLKKPDENFKPGEALNES